VARNISSLTHSCTFRTLYFKLIIGTTVINFVSGEVVVIHSIEFLKVSLLKQFISFLVCLNRRLRNAFQHFVISVFLCNNFYNNNHIRMTTVLN